MPSSSVAALIERRVILLRLMTPLVSAFLRNERTTWLLLRLKLPELEGTQQPKANSADFVQWLDLCRQDIPSKAVVGLDIGSL